MAWLSSSQNPTYVQSPATYQPPLPIDDDLEPQSESCCKCRNAVIALIVLAAFAALVVGILGMKEVVEIGDIGSKVMIGLSAGALGFLLINSIRKCYMERKNPQYVHVS